MRNKETVAAELIKRHFEIEDGLVVVFHFRGDREDDPNEPIKLVEVDEHTASLGFQPFYFGPSADVPFPVVIAVVTPAEWEEAVHSGALPEGWSLDAASQHERPAA